MEPRLRPLEGGAALSDREVHDWIRRVCIPANRLWQVADLRTIIDSFQSSQRVNGTNVSRFNRQSTSLSLMIDQKARFLLRGISAEFLQVQHDTRALQRVREGQHQLVFLTPENLFHGQGIRETLMAESFQSKLIAFVVDEAHCIKKW